MTALANEAWKVAQGSPFWDAGGPLLVVIFGAGWGALFWFEIWAAEAVVMFNFLKNVRMERALGLSFVANLASSAAGVFLLLLLLSHVAEEEMSPFALSLAWLGLGAVSVGIETPIWKLGTRSLGISWRRMGIFCVLANLAGYGLIVGLLIMLGVMMALSP